MLFKSSVTLLIFVLIVLILREVLKSPIAITDLSISHGNSVNLRFIYFAIVLLGVNYVRIVIPSWEMFIFIIG